MEGYQKDQSCPPRLQRDTTILESGQRGWEKQQLTQGKQTEMGCLRGFLSTRPRAPGFRVILEH